MDIHGKRDQAQHDIALVIAAAAAHRKRFERAAITWIFLVTIGVTIALYKAHEAQTHAAQVAASTCAAQNATRDYLRQRAIQLHHPTFRLPDLDCGQHRHSRHRSAK